MNKLTKILDTKAQEVAQRRALRSLNDLDAINAGPTRGFQAALQAKIDAGQFALIAV
jgi:indole-3-glycerol phosphate synthase